MNLGNPTSLAASAMLKGIQRTCTYPGHNYSQKTVPHPSTLLQANPEWILAILQLLTTTV